MGSSNEKVLFWASFFTLIAAGMGFAIRGDILNDWGRQFVLHDVVDDAQPAFHFTQEVVAGTQRLVFAPVEKAATGQRLQGRPGVGDAQRGDFPAVLELEELDQEFDIDDAAEAAFQVALTAACLQAAAHVANLIGQLRPPGKAVGALVHNRHHFAGKCFFPINGSCPR